MYVITFPENRSTTSGLQILLHGVISLPDATSYDKCTYKHTELTWNVEYLMTFVRLQLGSKVVVYSNQNADISAYLELRVGVA